MTTAQKGPPEHNFNFVLRHHGGIDAGIELTAIFPAEETVRSRDVEIDGKRVPTIFVSSHYAAHYFTRRGLAPNRGWKDETTAYREHQARLAAVDLSDYQVQVLETLDDTGTHLARSAIQERIGMEQKSGRDWRNAIEGLLKAFAIVKLGDGPTTTYDITDAGRQALSTALGQRAAS